METIAVVSPKVETWDAFISALAPRGFKHVLTVCSGAEALKAAAEQHPAAMVIDQDLGDMSGIDLVPRLLEINAMINVALVSDLPEETFHEVTEGLGILMKLPSHPGVQDVAEFCECIKGVV